MREEVFTGIRNVNFVFNKDIFKWISFLLSYKNTYANINVLEFK